MLNNHGLLHGIDYYGSYMGVQKKFGINTQRNNMDKALNLLKEFVIICIFICGTLCILAIGFSMYPEAKKMDCAMAEFSPDMALEVKQACREARSKK
jgi:hypothetical protein